MNTNDKLLFDKIDQTIAQLDIKSISVERLSLLQLLIDFVQEKKDTGMSINLNFICTHNSRRSHLSQVWAQTMAAYFRLPKVYCYSGGTEATALFPSVLETLSQSGFKIDTLSQKLNPVYAIKYESNSHPIIGFSKTYDHAFNPTFNFAAIMTCSQADENCPFVSGAEKRIPLTFEDPKAYDNTPMQAAKYEERSLQIATELYFVFSMVK